MAKGVYLKKNGERYYPAPYMPIGSIYLTVSNVNPSTYFGGTWEKMAGGYLYCAATSISNSTFTGVGTQNHTLTIDEMPKHTHNFRYNVPNVTINAGKVWGLITNSAGKEDTNTFTNNTVNEVFIRNAGGNQGHKHDIAWIGVFCWKRIA